jgi:predicted dehydrogenase
VRIGIIGCGLIGQKRATSAKGHDIAYVTDLSPARADEFAAKTGAKVAQDWQALIKTDVDVVIIATSHDTLSEIALAAVEAGKDVLVEKPGGRNAAEVIPIADAAKARGKIVKVGFNHRFHPAVLKAHEIFASGALGPMLYIRGRYGHGGRPGMETEWRCLPEISGGGELIDQGPHLIDLSRWFLGDLDLAFAATPTLFWDIPVDDNCFLALQSKTGQIAWLHATWTEWKNMFVLEIYGRDGKLTIDGLGGSYGLEKLTYHRMLPQMGPPETTIWEYPFPDTSWDREFAEFAAAISERRQPIGNLDDAIAVLNIVDKAYGRASK